MKKEDLINKKKRLLDNLIQKQYLKDKRLARAFLEVPLEEFIPNKYLDALKIYEDIPNLFYYLNQDNYRTISAPHMITIMLQGLSLEAKDDLLILGAKSGYIAALAHQLAPEGKILILEANSDIAKITIKNLNKLNYNNIEVIVKNPLEGHFGPNPWKKILVTGAINQERIFNLLKQLDPNEGVFYAPIGEGDTQIYTQILRINDDYFGKKQLPVRFTPLMTQVELDELELITDFEEITIKEDPKKVDETLSKIDEKIKIKFSSNFIDNPFLELGSKLDPEMEKIFLRKTKILTGKQKKNIIKLKEIKKNIKNLKKEDNVDYCFNCIDNIEEIFDEIQDFEKLFDKQSELILKSLNKIRSLNIVRKELEKGKSSEPRLIEKKIEIINNQIEEINKLEKVIKEQIKKLEIL